MTGVNLQAAMAEALRGSNDAARTFFELFLGGQWYVPKRFQSPRLEIRATYPNEFLDILGMQDGERVLVPVFSAAEQVPEWSQLPLACRLLTGQALLDLVPEGWWICVNPGQEVEKEISPWEIQQLRAGTAGIDAILAELTEQAPIETLTISSCVEEEYPQLTSALREYAQAQAEIDAIYLAKEEGRDEMDKRITTLLLGVCIHSNSPERLEQVRQSVRALAEKSLIGAEPVRVFTSAQGGNVMLSLFKGIEPMYAGPGSRAKVPWFHRLFSHHGSPDASQSTSTKRSRV